MNIESQVLNVPIEDIIPNRFQPRLNFDEEALKELSASIKEHGIIQPLVLRRLGDKYEIIAGERRYKAAKMAGLMSVPAIISAIDDQKSAEVAIVENVQRKDLSSIEEAKSYKALLDKGYLTQEELAKKMGLSQSAISNKLRLLSLSQVVQEALMEGKISERHARSLLQVTNFEEQEKWLKKIIDERITVRELDKRIKNSKIEEKEDIPLIEVNPNIEEIKSNATDIVTPVNQFEDVIKSSNNPENTIIPNKFFNYLEDESVNMSVSESETIDENMEEIEMLDFLAPENVISVGKDLKIANDLVDKLISDLNINNYKVNLVKDENSEEMQYIITVNKKED
ncbi:MAG: ParB/RepB/Spo0J family partition protein [Firmicutes bacterium]|nr:ParB/RepB/Spo0J family partition protein [Bacillota bacterium]